MQVLGLVGGEGFICRRCCEAVCDGLELDRSLSYDRSCTIIQSYPAYGKPMPPEPYNYELIPQHPRLLALYIGWVGQKISFLTHSAVTWDQSNDWSAAAAEVDRLVVVLHEAEKARVLNLPDETKAALGELVGHFAAGGWWTSSDGTRERMACQQARHEQDEFPDHELDPDDTPFQPCLLLEIDPDYSVAATAVNQLDAVLMQTAVAMDNLDECRLGVSLAGFCYRSTLQLGVPFINSVLNNLAACDMTDLESENEFRRVVGLSEVNEDRRPRSFSDPVSLQPLVLEDITADHNGQDPFAPYVGDMTDHRCLVLGCVFHHFDVPVPPTESDASQYPELAGLKKKFRAASVKTTKPSCPGTEGKHEGKGAPYYIEAAITYLGVHQLEVNPRKFVYRLVKKGALPARKINGRYVFFKAELDRVIANGDNKRKPGRPKKAPSA